MTEQDVRRIFCIGSDSDIVYRQGVVTVRVEDFLEVAGFKNCEPTKEAMLAFDGGAKGYRELIEQGSFDDEKEVPQ